MTLKDYIQGKRHGREANQLEREAMNDPFLEDAIDGFDSVQGNHSDIINQLEKNIDKKSKKKTILFRYTAISIAASIALLIGFSLIFNQKKSLKEEIAQVNEILSESVDADIKAKEEIAFNQTKSTQEKAVIKLSEPEKLRNQKPEEIISVVEDEIVSRDKNEKASEINISDSGNINIESDDDINVFPVAVSHDVSTVNTQTEKINTATIAEAKKIISGRVVDENGEPVVGATVYFNDRNGTITDLDGNFTLQKSEGKKLTAKYIGYQPQVVDIKDDLNIIQLQRDNLALNEVVVVGYGTKVHKSVTGAVSTVESKTTSRAANVRVNKSNETDKFEKEEFRQFILKNLKENICEGKEFSLTSAFKIDKTGKPYQIKIISSNCTEFESEFLRIIEISPAWTTVNKKIMFTITKP